MKKRAVKDVAASVRQKLLNNAKATNRPFQEVLQYFAMERFLYRLTQSPYADKFVLKGALMFTVWGAPATRPTKDIDFLARTENTIAAVVPIIRAVCIQPVEPDGLLFDDTTVEGALIKEDADYEGIRVTFLATLQNARVPMQPDLGYGQGVYTPSPHHEYSSVWVASPALPSLMLPRGDFTRESRGKATPGAAYRSTIDRLDQELAPPSAIPPTPTCPKPPLPAFE